MKLALYGTLRRGQYNYDSYIGDEHEPLGTDQIEGYTMYSLSDHYPYVAVGDGSILVEVYDLPQEIADDIERMERGAGYEMAEVETAYGKAHLFYMSAKDAARYAEYGYPVIESGDWIKYLERSKHGQTAGYNTGR